MAIQIASALSKGFNNTQILKHIAKQYPQYATQINNALAVGYTADAIVKHLATPKEKAKFKTAFERSSEGWRNKKRNAELTALSAIGTAGALAAGGLSLLGTGNRAVRPTQILPAQRVAATQNLGQQPPIRTYQKPNAPQAQLGGPQGLLPPPSPPSASAPPKPSSPRKPLVPQTPSGQALEPLVTPYEVDPQKSFKLVKSLEIDKQLDKVLASGLETHVIAQVLKETLPKNKIVLLEKAPGGIEKALEDYSRIRQAELQELPRTEAFKKFNENKKNKLTIREQELERINKAPVRQTQITPAEAYNEQMSVSPTMQETAPVIEEMKALQPLMPVKQDINKKILGTASGIKYPTLEGKSLGANKEKFYIPNYKNTNETLQEFKDRKLLHDAINKAATAIKEGKSFLDFPINKELIKARGGYSTAADVLKFMAGIPNTYDEFLDDEEKNELAQSFNGDENRLQGSHMTPNLIWNLLLSIEPKIASLVPNSIKKDKTKKMSSTESKRFLTHSVYNVLSGQKLSSELADKIEKISSATQNVDIIVKALKAGNDKKMFDEMERLWKDDSYFFSLFEDEALKLYGERP